MKRQIWVGLATSLAILGIVGSANATSFTDDFNDGTMDGWTQKIGSWSITDGNLSNSGSVYGVAWKDDSFGVYQKIQVDAYFDFSTNTKDDEIGHLRLRTNNHTGATQPFWDTGYLADFQKDRIRVYNTYMGGNPQIASFVFSDTPFTYNGWYELAFSVDGTGSDTHFNTWVNDIKYIDQTYNNTIADLDSGYVGLGRKICYDNVIGYSSSTPVPEPATMLLFGTGVVGLLGTSMGRKKKQ